MTEAQPNVGLVWGVKASFLNYLALTGDAATSVMGAAAPTTSGKFFFGPAAALPIDHSAEPVTLKFLGKVQFSAHGGMLNVQIRDPWVTSSATECILSIAEFDAAGGMSRIPLLSLEPTEPTVEDGIAMWAAVPARLRTEGRYVFNDFYPADELFDPVTIRASAQQVLRAKD